jgi:hypothetical protein
LMAAMALAILCMAGPVWAADLTVDNGSTLSVPPDISYDNEYIDGILSQTAGTNTISNNLYLGYHYYPNTGGVYNLSGGTNQITGDLYIGVAGAAGGYNLGYKTGLGSLSATNEYIGLYGIGGINQTGGTNTASNLILLGVSSGGMGDYNQKGGTTTANLIELGYSTGSSGSYELYGVSSLFAASLSAPTQIVGVSGTGIFIQDIYSTNSSSQLIVGQESGTGTYSQVNGTNTVSSSLYLGYLSVSTGNYELGADGSSSASLSAPNQYIGYSGTGTFTQYGGTNTADTLTIATNLGSSGKYSLQGGTLTVGTITVNPGGSFYHTGGTLNGTLVDYGNFSYQGTGVFNGRLVLYNTPYFYSDFTAGDGLANYTNLTIGPGRLITLDGQGLDNSGTLTLAGGTLDGLGRLVNNGTMLASGTISGSGGFENNGFFLQSGNLTLDNIGDNINLATMNLAPSSQFTLGLDTQLSNGGNISLNDGFIGGPGVLYNNGSHGGTAGIITGPGRIDCDFYNRGLLSVPYGRTSITKPFVNTGIIQLENSGAMLQGGAIDNNGHGAIEGYGTVVNDINNAGRIEAIGSTLNLNGTVTNNAYGVLTSMSGKLFLSQGLANNAGTISLSGGAFDNNNQPMTNTGQHNSPFVL